MEEWFSEEADLGGHAEWLEILRGLKDFEAFEQFAQVGLKEGWTGGRMELKWGEEIGSELAGSFSDCTS